MLFSIEMLINPFSFSVKNHSLLDRYRIIVMGNNLVSCF